MRVTSPDDQQSSNPSLRPKLKGRANGFDKVMQISDLRYQKDRRMTPASAVLGESQIALSLEHQSSTTSAELTETERDQERFERDDLDGSCLYFESLFSRMERRFSSECFQDDGDEATILNRLELQDGSQRNFKVTAFQKSEHSSVVTVVDFATAKARKYERTSDARHDHRADQMEFNTVKRQQLDRQQRIIPDGLQGRGNSVETALQMAEEHETLSVDASDASMQNEAQRIDAAVLQSQEAASSLSPVEQITRHVADQMVQLVEVRSDIDPSLIHNTVTSRALRLNLHPAELGLVDVTISKRGTRLEVVIVPELESTSEILRGDTNQLLQSLGLATAETAHLHVRIETSTGAVDMGDNAATGQAFAQSDHQSMADDSRTSQDNGVEPKWREGIQADARIEAIRATSSVAQRRSDALYV